MEELTAWPEAWEVVRQQGHVSLQLQMRTAVQLLFYGSQPMKPEVFLPHKQQ